MELYSAEAKALQGLIKDWLAHPETELEASFGQKGQVDASTFLAIATRLRARGFKAKPQIDRLSVLLPDQIRFQINGFGVIQQYCRDDRMSGKPFVAMIKDRTVGTTANLDLEEYNTRVKARRELPLDANDPKIKEILTAWNQTKKAFRLIRRWSFEGHGVVFDLSMIRSSAQDARGNYRFVRRFGDYNIVGAPPTYEVEVELVRGEENPDVATATKNLVGGLSTILRGIQKNTLLIRKSVAAAVLDNYKDVAKTDRFRGVAPVTLETRNITAVQEEGTPNIRNGYNVTEKADGLRVHAFCDKHGELFMIDMGMNVYRTGYVATECKNSLLDGEYVTRTKDNKPIEQLLLFDIYVAPGTEDVTKLPFFEGRHRRLENWLNLWKEAKPAKGVAKPTLQVAMKKFVFATPGDTSIFRACAQVLDTSYIYYTDGLILTPNSAVIPSQPGTGFREQFKWKPAEDNTIDFLVLTEKDPEVPRIDRVQTGIHPDTGETITYKTLRLYVGSSRDQSVEDPRNAILFEKPLAPEGQAQRLGPQGQGQRQYRPVLFNPKDNPDTMASVCYVLTETDPDTGEQYIRSERSGDVIRDRSIVEMAYDPARSPGWRWYPMRVRTDKTERLMKGTLARTLNSEEVGESVWNSIHDPVTESMIRTGSEEPTQEEIKSLLKAIGERAEVGKKYYERKAPAKDLIRVKGLRDFHNRWIKDTILYGPVMKPGGKNLLDLAVGKAGDLQRWRRGGVGFVLGVDYAGENIRDPNDGAYRRLVDSIRTAGPAGVPPMVFAIGDSSKNLITGEAGATAEEADILRTVLGRSSAQAAVPPYVEKVGAGRLRNGADIITCMFAIHYFFQSAETFKGFLQNVSENLKIGGYFIGCAFDGERIFDALRKIPEGQAKIGVEDNATLWKITKRYSVEDIPLEDEGFGLPIDVEFISIGSSHREYLVPLPLLVSKFKSIGLELVGKDGLRELGLVNSTAMFEESFRMAAKAGKKFAMGDAVREFSFFNRWFIFKRVASGAEVEAATVATATAAATAEAPATEAAPPEPVVEAQPMNRKFKASEVINFYTEAGVQDKLGIKDPEFARYIAPSAYFSIPDPDDAKTLYPSLEHFINGMKYKVASNKPELGKAIFSVDGSIYNKYATKRSEEMRAASGKKLSSDRDAALLKDETNDLRKETTPAAFKRNKTVFNEVTWNEKQDELLRYALNYRYDKDPRYRRIIEAARSQGKILLYYTPAGAASELGGKRRANDERIEGQNKIGRIMMEIAGFTGF